MAWLLERCGRWRQSSWWVRCQWEQESRAAPGSWWPLPRGVAAEAEAGLAGVGGAGSGPASAVWVLRGSRGCAVAAGWESSGGTWLWEVGSCKWHLQPWVGGTSGRWGRMRDAGPGLALQHEKSGGGAAPKEAEEWPVWLEGHGVDGMRGEKLPGQMASWLHEVQQGGAEQRPSEQGRQSDLGGPGAQGAGSPAAPRASPARHRTWSPGLCSGRGGHSPTWTHCRRPWSIPTRPHPSQRPEVSP